MPLTTVYNRQQPIRENIIWFQWVELDNSCRSLSSFIAKVYIIYIMRHQSVLKNVPVGYFDGQLLTI